MTDHSHHQHTPAATHARPMSEMAHSGHDHGDMVSDFRRRFCISIALTVPVLATSEMVQTFCGLRIVLCFAGERSAEFELGAPIYVYGCFVSPTGLKAE